MRFSQGFINEKIQQLRALQNDIYYLERRKAEEQQKIQDALDAKAEKDRLKEEKAKARAQRIAAAKKKREQAKEEGVVLAPATAAQQAKAILKARKQRKQTNEAIQADKILPARTGPPPLEGKVRVRLSHNLEVWASPDADIGELKQKFLHRNQRVEPKGGKGKKSELVAKELTPGMIYNLIRLGEQ